MKTLGILFVTGYVMSAGVAHAATYYTATNGVDAGRTCAQARSISTPKLTINGGISCLAAGDTLLVRAGTYDEYIAAGAVPSGSAGAYTRIAAYPGTSSPAELVSRGVPAGWETVWMTSTTPTPTTYSVARFSGTQQYIDIDGINLNCLRMGNAANGAAVDVVIDASTDNPNHIRFHNAEWIFGSTVAAPVRKGGGGGSVGALVVGPSTQGGNNEFINLLIHGGGDQGTFQDGSGNPLATIQYAFYIEANNTLVAGCEIHHTGTAGIQIYNGFTADATNTTIRNNLIHDVVYTDAPSPGRFWGIVTGNETGAKIYNNVIWNVGTTSASIDIALTNGTLDEIYNNTLYGGSGGNGILLNGVGTATIRSNISYNHAAGDYSVGSLPVDHNLSGDSTATGTGSIANANPLFVNTVTRNFQIQSSSPAKNAGATITLVAADQLGVVRPQGPAYDIGAYEFRAQGSPPTVPTLLQVLVN